MLRFIRPPRLLPVLVAVASLALAVRVGGIGQDIANGAAIGFAVPGANASETTEGAPALDESKPQGDADGTTDTKGDAPTDPAAADAAAAPETEAAALSASEIEVLQQLAKRRDKLAERERETYEREALLRAAEARIEQKVVEFKELRATLEELIRTYEDHEDSRIRSLVKIYENMKPRDAARIFEELELDTLLLVAARMKERKLSPIMATMNPAKAKEVTVELARRRQLPEAARLRARAPE